MVRGAGCEEAGWGWARKLGGFAVADPEAPNSEVHRLLNWERRHDLTHQISTKLIWKTSRFST